ncbi:MAG: phosphoenolpyruvate carboxylase [Azospirillaceae bacterium]
MPDSGPATENRQRPSLTTAFRGALPDGALIAGPEACFAPQDDSPDWSGMVEELVATLDRHEAARDDDPFSNPVLLLTIDLLNRLARRELSHAQLEQLVQWLTVEGWAERAERLGRYVGETDPAANEERLRDLFRELAKARKVEELGNESAEKVRFEIFRERVEREVFGIVITAHPTFTQPTSLMRAMAALAAGRDNDGTPLSETAIAEAIREAAGTEHRPDADISLDREHALSLEAIDNIQHALRRVYDLLLETAAELYPERWQELKPRLVTIASWVGYDLDGRSDIRWSDTLHKRLVVQSRQLAHYLEEVRALRAGSGPATETIAETLDLIESRLALAASHVGDEIEAFAAPPSDPDKAVDQMRRVAKRMHEGQKLRLVDSASLVEMIDRAINRLAGVDGAVAVQRRLVILRAELANHGLGSAHTHVRINSTQVHNAIRKSVDLASDPNDPRYRQSYIDKISALLDGVSPETINFASLMGERTSVKRLFMIVTQMLKYTGRTAPVRFLIAETESAFTLLTALYYAKLFGVEDHVDISPLFETERALEVGSRMIDTLLENPHYRAHIEKRGRIAVQTGYSDAGRFIGQTPANASIERLRLRLTRTLARHQKEGRLKGVELLIFDTHGESIGRGAHPRDFAERLANIDTQATRGYMEQTGIAFKQEMSFQGGDGYLYFVNRPLAFAVVTRILEHTLSHGHSSAGDPFYDEASFIREFFTTVKEFQVSLMEDNNYGVLLTAFGTNLLFQSGSRPLKRQHEDPTDIDHASASQLRAIPHNAVLQQLGLLANTVSGVGAAIARDPAKFQRLYRESDRLRQLMGLVEYGAAISDPQIMKAYVDTLDPGLWIIRAAQSADPATAEDLLRIGDVHEASRIHERQNRVFRKLFKDFTQLMSGLAPLADEAGDVGCMALVPDRQRKRLRLLHAIRIALMHEIYRLAMRTPEFSSRHRLTPRELVAHLIHLDVDSVVDMLEEIFPTEASTLDMDDFGEQATYRSDEDQSYRFENEYIFKPMRGLYRIIRRVSTATAHRTGFFG